MTKPNSLEELLNEVMQPNTKEIKEREKFNEIPEITSKKLLKLEKEKLIKTTENANYYNKNREKILKHKAKRVKMKAALKKILLEEFTLLLTQLPQEIYLEGNYDIRYKTKDYEFQGKIKLKANSKNV